MAKRTLTPVFDGAKDLPVRAGWYPTYVKAFFEFDELPTQTIWPRRYWNGRFFSQPVVRDDSDKRAKVLQNTPTLYESCDIYWCGLTAPYES
ncbi:MAG: hypothetical protein KGI52_03490 [Burkholderiales bacterium]|nr:hypothetical protein [Burkholderiales bacterium]